jgi:hypothetical protein
MADHIIGFVTGGVSKAIAITSEVVAGDKGKASAARRRASQAQSQQAHGIERRGSASDNEEQQNLTEFEWALEELEEELGDPPAYTPAGEQAMVNTPQGLDRLQRLPQPVVIPQRRPGSRGRGFMRAYAPVLSTHANLDQSTFLKFLGDLDNATSASPIVSHTTETTNMYCSY